MLVNWRCGASAQRSRIEHVDQSAGRSFGDHGSLSQRVVTAWCAGEDRETARSPVRRARTHANPGLTAPRLCRCYRGAWREDRSRARPLAPSGARGARPRAQPLIVGSRPQHARRSAGARRGGRKRKRMRDCRAGPARSVRSRRANQVGLPGRSETFSNRNSAAEVAHGGAGVIMVADRCAANR